MTVRWPAPVAIQPDPAAQGTRRDSPTTLAVAEALPDRCSEHGNVATTWLPTRVKFNSPESESHQLTFGQDVMDVSRGALTRFFQPGLPDAVVTTDWPCCALCLRRMRYSLWAGRLVIGATVVAVAVFFVVAVMTADDDSYRQAGFVIMAIMPTLTVVVTASIRGAFSYTRPILHARLNEDRTEMIVSAAHPDFGTALDELRTDQLDDDQQIDR